MSEEAPSRALRLAAAAGLAGLIAVAISAGPRQPDPAPSAANAPAPRPMLAANAPTASERPLVWTEPPLPAQPVPSAIAVAKAAEVCPVVADGAEAIRRDWQRGHSWRALREVGRRHAETAEQRDIYAITFDAAEFSASIAEARAMAEAGCRQYYLSPPDAPRAPEPAPTARVSAPSPSRR